MNKISMKFKQDTDTYSLYSNDSYSIYVLGLFLSTKMGICVELSNIYQWLQNSSGKLKKSINLVDLEKLGSYIRMILEFDEELYEDDPEEFSLNISATKLIKIMEDWYKIVQNRPKYIIIQKENNEYYVIASNEPHKPSKTIADYENKLKTVIGLIDNTYSIVVKKDDKFTILANFLIDDATEQGSFEEWAKYAKDKVVSNNGTVLEKINNNILLYLNSDPNNHLTIAIDQFIYILEKWHRLLLRKISFVLIKEEEGRYSIIASRHNPTVPRVWSEEEDDDDPDKIDWDSFKKTL